MPIVGAQTIVYAFKALHESETFMPPPQREIDKVFWRGRPPWLDLDITLSDWPEIYRRSHEWIGARVGDTIKHPDGVEEQRFDYATLYRRRNKRIFEVHGAIRAHYESLGSRNSWLGLPESDEIPFEDGRVSAFQHGAIYWWPDTGPIDINQIAVAYMGFMCYDETYDGIDIPGHDEVYGIISATSPAGVQMYNTQIYEGVDAGESRVVWGAEIYRGPPAGLILNSLLMERDEGNENYYRETVKGAVNGVAAGLGLLTGLIPVAGPVVAPIVTPILTAAANEITPAVNKWLDTRDDVIGNQTMALSAKQLIVLARKTSETNTLGVPYRFKTNVMRGHDSKYEVAFNIWPQ